MQKYLKYLTYILLPLCIVWVLLIQLFTKNISEDSISKLLPKDTKYQSMSFSKFPYPKVELNELTINNTFINKLEITFCLLDIIKMNFNQAGYIKASGIQHTQNEQLSKLGLSNFLIQNEILKLPAYKIKITDSLLTLKDKQLSINDFDLSKNKEDYEINALINDKSLSISYSKNNLSLNLKGNHYDLSINGKYGDNLLKEGDLKLDISNLTQFGKTYFNDTLLNYINAKNGKFLASFTVQNDTINFDNIEVDIDNSKGNGNLSYNMSGPSKINLELDKINIHYPDQNLISKIINTASLNITRYIKIKELQIAEQQLNDVIIDASQEQDTLKVNSLSANFGDKLGNVNLYGEVLQKSFNGQIEFSHQDINILLNNLSLEWLNGAVPTSIGWESKLSMNPEIIKLQDILSTAGDNIIISGNLEFIPSQTTKPYINSNLSLTSVDNTIINYPIIYPLYNYLLSLFNNIYDHDYLIKFGHLRSPMCNGNFDIKWKNEQQNELQLKGTLEDNALFINDYFIKTQNHSLKGNGEIITRELYPIISINLNNAESILPNITSDNINSLKQLIDNYINLSNLLFNLSLNWNKINFDNLEAKNVNLIINTENGIVNIKNCNAEIWNGTVSANGVIIQDPFKINLVYAHNNADISKFMKLIPNFSIISNTGIISTSGELTIKNNLADFNNLDLNSKFIAKKLTINNLGIDDLVAKIINKNYNANNLKNDLEYASNHGKTTINEMEGEYLLEKGILSFKNIKFLTKNTSGTAANNINLYNENINGISKFYFYSNQDKDKVLSIPMTTSETYSYPIKILEYSKELEDEIKLIHNK